MADTSFEEGAGLIIIPRGTSQAFRTLLTIIDNPPRVGRVSGDNSPMVRCARKCQCAAQGTDAGTSYDLVIEGPIDVAAQLLGPRKGDVIYAVVAWRTMHELTLLALAPAPMANEELTALKSCFKEETQL